MSPKIIYLDQNIWIYFSEAYYGVNKDAKIKRICDKVIKASESNSFIFPLSLIHLCESHHQQNPQKRDGLIEFMLKISKGYTITNINSIKEAEIRNAILKKIGYRTIDIKDFVIEKGFPNMLGAKGTIQGNIPDSVKNSMIEWINSPEAMIKILKSRKIFDKDDSFIDALDRIEKKRSIYVEIKDPQIRFKCFLAKEIMKELSPTVAKILFELDIYNSIFERPDEKEIMDFIKEVPTFYVLFNLSYRRENSKKRINRNDLYDIAFLSMAIPYCDIVVTEKRFASIAKSIQLDEIYRTVILPWSSIDELEKHL